MSGRLSQGQIIAAVGAVVLMMSMFLPWIGVSGPSIPAGIPVPQGVSTGGTSENVWKGYTLDIYLLITVIFAALPALLALTDASEEFSFVSAATFLLGVVGTILLTPFSPGLPRRRGPQDRRLLGLAAAIAIAVGGFRAMQDEVAAEIWLGPGQHTRGGTLDANRLSQGQLIAALAAVALFIISFLPWFGVSGAVTVGRHHDRRVPELQPLGSREPARHLPVDRHPGRGRPRDAGAARRRR